MWKQSLLVLVAVYALLVALKVALLALAYQELDLY